MKIKCTGCGAIYTVPESAARKSARCKTCLLKFRIPKIKRKRPRTLADLAEDEEYAPPEDDIWVGLDGDGEAPADKPPEPPPER